MTQLLKEILTFILSFLKEVKYITDAVYFHEVDLPKSYWRFTLMRPLFKYEEIPIALKSNFCPLFWTTNVLLVIWVFAFIPYILVRLLGYVADTFLMASEPYRDKWQAEREQAAIERSTYKLTKLTRVTPRTLALLNYTPTKQRIKELASAKLGLLGLLEGSANARRNAILDFSQLLLYFKLRGHHFNDLFNPTHNFWFSYSVACDFRDAFVGILFSKDGGRQAMAKLPLLEVAKLLYALHDEFLVAEFWATPQLETATVSKKTSDEKLAAYKAEAKKRKEEEENNEDAAEDEDEDEDEDENVDEYTKLSLLEKATVDKYEDPREALRQQLILVLSFMGFEKNEFDNFSFNTQKALAIIEAGPSSENFDYEDSRSLLVFLSTVQDYFAGNLDVTNEYFTRYEAEQLKEQSIENSKKAAREAVRRRKEMAEQRKADLEARFKWLIKLTPLIQKTAKIFMFFFATIAFGLVVFKVVPLIGGFIAFVAGGVWYLIEAVGSFFVDLYHFIDWSDFASFLFKLSGFMLSAAVLCYFANTILLELSNLVYRLLPSKARADFDEFEEDYKKTKSNGAARLLTMIVSVVWIYFCVPLSDAFNFVWSGVSFVFGIVTMIVMFPVNVIKLFYKSNCPAIKLVDDKDSTDNPA